MGKLLANDFLRQGAPMKQIGIGVCALLWALPAGTKSMGVHALRGRLEKEVLLYTLAEGVARCAHQGARKPPCPGGTAYERNFILVVIRSTTTNPKLDRRGSGEPREVDIMMSAPVCWRATRSPMLT
jgi:hypothetical protein